MTKKQKVFTGPEEKDWEEIERVANELPDMHVDYRCACEDEEGIYEEDIVTISVTLTRLAPGQINLDSKVIRSEVAAEEDDAKDDGTPDVIEIQDAGADDDSLTHPTEDDNADLELLAVKEKKLLETLPVAKPKPSRFANNQGKLVHAPFFPFPKRERWIVILSQKSKKNTSVPLIVQKVTPFEDTATVEMHLRVGQKGVWPYEIQAKCDSYVGCDVQIPFKITVKKMGKAEISRREDQISKGKAHGLDEEEEEDDEEAEGVWYYFYFTSFWEMLLNVIVLGVLLVFAVNFLQTRGYWAKFVQPIIDIFYKALHPIYLKVYTPVYTVIAPYVDPIIAIVVQAVEWLVSKLTVDPDELMKVKEEF